MPLNLGVGHTFLKTIVYLGLLEIGYSSEVNTGADTVSASLVLERLGTLGGESRPPGWGIQQRRDGRWPIRRRGRAGLRLRGASCGKLGGSVAGLERGGGGGTAGSQRPPGAWTPCSARARLLAAPCTRPPRAHDLPSRTKGAASLPSPA